MNKCIELGCQKGTSDKVYHVELKQVDEGFVVNYANGRRGSSLRGGTKTQEPVSLDKARVIFDRLVKSKIKGGYSVNGETGGYEVAESKCTGIECQLLNEVVDKSQLNVLMNFDDWVVQEKYDGERKMIKSCSGNLLAINKLGNSTGYVKSVGDSVLQVGCDLLVDGEAVGDLLYVFDLLEYDGVNLRGMPYSQRYEMLQRVSFGEFVRVVSTALGINKRTFFDRMIAENAEGVVFKKADAVFTPNRPASGGDQLKYKFYDTASVFVSCINEKRSVGMSVFVDNGDEVFIGNVTIPANRAVPSINEVIEVRYLYFHTGGCLFQPVYLFTRTDVLKKECVIGQLKHKRIAA